MDEQAQDTAPNAERVVKYLASRIWRSKWLIGAASVIVAALTFVLYKPAATNEIWTGRATLTIGLGPGIDYILQSSGSPRTLLENARSAITRLSDPDFKATILSSTQFEQPTADFSRSMVRSSLKGNGTDSDRDVNIELSAGSKADVSAALTAVSNEVLKIHQSFMEQRTKPLQARIDEAKTRLAEWEAANEKLDARIAKLNERLLGPASGDDSGGEPRPLPRAVLQPPHYIGMSASWSVLRDRIVSDTTLMSLREPSVVHMEPVQSIPARSVGTLRVSILAGLGMLIAMIILTTAINSRVRP